MMKMTRRKMMMTASALALGTLVLAGSAALAAPAGNDIGSEKAQQIALQHAGVSESDTRRMEIDFDYEHGMAVYEIEWKVGWTEYSYEINASTGEVVSHEMDYDD